MIYDHSPADLDIGVAEFVQAARILAAKAAQSAPAESAFFAHRMGKWRASLLKS